MGNRILKEIFQMIFYCVILISLYFGLSGTGQAKDEDSFQQLKDILTVMDKYQVDVTEWTLYSRENLSYWKDQSGFFDEFQALQEKTADFSWEANLTKERNGQMRAVATRDHFNKLFVETLTYIVFPHNEEYHSYLIYEVKGTEKVTEDLFQSLFSIVDSRLEDLFETNTIIFTCVSGNTNDKLNFDLSEKAELFLNEFSGQEIEQLKEETFISVSAYTNTWNNAITTTNQQKMNLQVAIRAKERLGGKTTVTIGTPIITTEY